MALHYIDYLKHLPEGHPDVVNAEGKLKCMLSIYIPRIFKIVTILASLSIMHVYVMIMRVLLDYHKVSIPIT